MRFSLNRDKLLKSLSYAQGVVEKKKHTSNFVECFNKR